MSNSLRIALITIILSGMLLVASCARPSASSLPVTSSPPATIEPDLMQAVQIVQNALAENHPDLLRSIIGDEGVAVQGFAMGAGYEGHNNSDEIVAEISEALEISLPTCIGFLQNAGSLPDKAILVYKGLQLDWNYFGIEREDSDGATIQLFEFPEGWRLVYITPFDFEVDLPVIEPLRDCPAE